MKYFDNANMYHEFKTGDEATEWGRKNFPELFELTETDSLYGTLYAYTGSAYKLYNVLLRQMPEIGTEEYYNKSKNLAKTDDYYEECFREIDSIYSVIQSMNIEQDIVTYRYTKLKDLKSVCKKIKVGNIIKEKAFLSTGLVLGKLKKFAIQNSCNCLLKLYLRKETNAIYVSLPWEHTCLDEQELLIAPCTEMKIVKIHWFTWPRLIECEIKS